MATAPPPNPDRVDLLFDLGGFGLLAIFVGVLLAEALWPIPASSYVATTILLGAFGVVCLANRRRDRVAKGSSRPDPP